MRFSVHDVAAAVDGSVHGDGGIVVDGAAVDSRLISGGELFVPLVAERDGHDFIEGAIDAGAGAVLTQQAVDRAWSRPAIAVADTAAALLDVGRLARRRLGPLVVGITGSVGKTSAKDLCAAALARRYRTAASARSFNNEIGVPLTLANAADDTQAAVVEMGARGRGHITLLCDVARPSVGVVTAVAHAHTEMFGSIEEVAVAKGELVESLPAAGTAVLNGDDPRVRAMASRTAAGVLLYSVAAGERGDAGADIVAEGLRLDDELRGRFTLRTPGGSAEVALEVRGEHQVANALAAAGAALACGVGVDDVAAGLGDAVLSPWRMDLRRSPSGAVVLNDAYNANPTSMAAALRSLAAVPAVRRIAVLGVMAELGPMAAGAHASIAELAAELGIEVVAVATDAYGPGAVVVDDVGGAVGALAGLGAGDAVLVKGSRVVGLERVAAALLDG